MVGATNMDIGFVQAKTLDELFATFGDKAARARSLLNPTNSTNLGEVAFRVGGDQMMAEPARQIARTFPRAASRRTTSAFHTWRRSMRKQVPGAPHATDIPFAFDTVAARYGKDLTVQDAALAKAMHEYWVTFARTGKPVAKGHPDWPAYTAKNDLILDFTNAGPVAVADPSAGTHGSCGRRQQCPRAGHGRSMIAALFMQTGVSSHFGDHERV